MNTKKKRAARGVFFLALAICLCACRRSRDEYEFSEKSYAFRLAESHPAGYPTTMADEHFARLVEERSQGRIKIEVVTDGNLGDEKSVIEQVQFGGIDFARVSVAPLSYYKSEFSILTLPYLYENKAHYWDVLNGKVGRQFLHSLEDAGFYGLCFYDAGARSFYAMRPIRSLEDFKGMTFRVQENSVMESFVRRLGANTVPIPYIEVRNAFASGMLDGADNNWPSYDTAGHCAYARYFAADEHSRVPDIVLASSLVMNSLTMEDRLLIRQCASESMAYQVGLWQEYEDISRNRMLEHGAIVSPIPENVIAELKRNAFKSYREIPHSQLHVLEEIFTLGQKHKGAR